MLSERAFENTRVPAVSHSNLPPCLPAPCRTTTRLLSTVSPVRHTWTPLPAPIRTSCTCTQTPAHRRAASHVRIDGRVHTPGDAHSPCAAGHSDLSSAWAPTALPCHLLAESQCRVPEEPRPSEKAAQVQSARLPRLSAPTCSPQLTATIRRRTGPSGTFWLVRHSRTLQKWELMPCFSTTFFVLEETLIYLIKTCSLRYYVIVSFMSFLMN